MQLPHELIIRTHHFAAFGFGQGEVNAVVDGSQPAASGSFGNVVRSLFDSSGAQTLQEDEQALTPFLRQGIRKKERGIVAACSAYAFSDARGIITSDKGVRISSCKGAL